MSDNEQINTYTGEIHAGNELALSTTSDPQVLRAKMQRMSDMIKLKKEFLKNNLTEGLNNDFAIIPGTKERSLLKPGAEKLLDWHGYYPSFVVTAEKEDWEIDLFAYTYRCDIKQKGSNILLAQCEGDCSTHESKYRFEWKYESQLPTGTDLRSLPQRVGGRGENKGVQYRILVDNLADKRNTVRKMAQKRAFIGATVLATATSDLFTTKDPDEGEPGSEGGDTTGSATSQASATVHTKPLTDAEAQKKYGDTISQKQSGRLYGIRQTHKIDNQEFKAWLLAKYGLDDDRKIGRGVYEEICTACEKGTLEMPRVETQPAEPAAAQPEGKEPTKATPGATLSVSQIKALNSAIHDNKRTDKQFLAFLENFDGMYASKGINDVLAEDFYRLMTAWDAAVKEGAV